MQTQATYHIYVDWNNDGQYDHAYSDISGYVLNFNWSYGRIDGPPTPDSVGYSTILLKNDTSIFSPYNSDSPIYGLILPNRLVKCTMTVGASTVTMFQHYLETITPTVGEAGAISGTAELMAHGPLGQLTDAVSDMAVQGSIGTGDAIDALLDGYGWPESLRAIDEGITTLSHLVIDTDTPLLSVMRSVQDAELGRLREGKDGKIVFENRNDPFTSPRDTPQATYGTGTLKMWDLEQQDALPAIYNVAQCRPAGINISEYMVLALVADVSAQKGGTPPKIEANSSRTFYVEFPNDSSTRDYSGVYQWGTVEYAAHANKLGSGTDYAASVSTVTTELGNKQKIVFTNNLPATDVYLTKFKAWGRAYVLSDPVLIKSEDATSISKYGRREYPHQFILINDPEDAQSCCDYAVSVCKDPRARVRFNVRANVDLAHLSEAQTRDIGDRIRAVASVAESGLGIDAEFIVDFLAHSVGEASEHTMTVICTVPFGSQLGAISTPYAPYTVTDPVRIFTEKGYLSVARGDDTGNPSGCGSLAVLTHEDDANIPYGCMGFSFNRDTSNYDSVYAFEVALGTATPLHGPYAAQRAAHPADVLASGYGITVIPGKKTMDVTVSGAFAEKLFLIYGGGDTGLDANVIASHGSDSIRLSQPFYKSGVYNWAIVDDWKGQNYWDHTFYVPEDMRLCGDNTVWKTGLVIMSSGTVYAQGFTRNLFGMSDA